MSLKMSRKARRRVLKVLGGVVGIVGIAWLVLVLWPAPTLESYGGPDVPEDVRAQMKRFTNTWDNPDLRSVSRESMRATNPEWDLISSTFVGYSLANVALAHPDERESALGRIDTIIAEMLATPWRDFLLPYGRDRAFVYQPEGSLMVDGEIALLIGLRRLVAEDPGSPYRAVHRRYVERCVSAMEASPVLCAESYPNECWLFCNTIALAAIRVYDVVEGADHSDLFRRWEATARARLVHAQTGLLYSAFTPAGEPVQPPEGSSIWSAVAFLKPVCPTLADEQYVLAKKHLIRRFAGLTYGREWPRGVEGVPDIDSVFTPFGAGPASTGFSLVAAKEMDDGEVFSGVLKTVNIIGRPVTEDGALRYRSSNFVGDAVFLLGKTAGPAWRELDRRSR